MFGTITASRITTKPEYMQRIILLLTFLVSLTAYSQSVTIKGYAPAYVGETISANEIEDYFSFYEKTVAKAKVNDDSTFTMTFDIPKTEKIILRGGNNKTFLYVQPNASYTVYMPDKDPYEPYRKTGNEVELTFFDLDSMDINYRILGFQRWVDYFIGNTYYRKDADSTNADYVKNLDDFKTAAQEYYKSDTSMFLKTYIKFTFAGLDNVQHAAERNRYEKYDFYIKGHPVSYENEVYMEYIRGFYQNMLPRLHDKINEGIYQGVLNASPTLIMHSLGFEYTLKNLRMREMIMLKMLSEEYYSGEFPQTNILTVMDSVAKFGLAKENRVIAANLKSRLTELVPGVKAPEFVLSQKDKETKTTIAYKGKYIYLHFMDPTNTDNIRDLILLKDLHKKYNENVEFITIYQLNEELDTSNLEALKDIPWDVYGLKPTNSIWKNYQVSSFPHYTLIDAFGYIVASPALAPTPNGQYETIDKTFYLIKQAIERRR